MPTAFKLIIEDDAGKQIVVPFTRDVITIGRKEGNTIRLTERNVSRNHARLSRENGHVVLEDMGSFNGIKLNGDRIDGRVHVHEGDTIQIGDYHLALHAQDGAGLNAPTAQMTVPGATSAPPLKSAGGTGGGATEDDEFAGDTQRWEPPAGMPGISVQSLPTQEDRPPVLEDTERATAVRPRELQSGGFGVDGGDTERVSMDMLDSMKAGAPSVPTRARDAELEPTVRQPSAPPPITLPPSAPSSSMPSPTGPTPLAASTTLPMPLSPGPGQGAQNVTAPTPVASGLNGGGQNAALAAAAQPQMQPLDVRAPALPQQPASVRAPQQNRALEEQTEQHRPAPLMADDVALPRLVVLNTIFAGSSFTLRSPEAVIGRTEENDITIEHKSVSRNHAKLVREGDRVRILDLKSANGILVNNEEVEAAVLKPGDVVELGRVKLRFVPVGERFAVPPDEIERARIADAAGDDFDGDAHTGVTNPVRQKQKAPPPPSLATTTGDYQLPRSGPPQIALIGGGAAVVVIVILILVFALRGGDDEKKEDVPQRPTPGVKADADPPPGDPAATDPAATDPAATDPAATDPAATDPAKADPGVVVARVDEPKADEPKTDGPKADEPKTDAPKTDPPADTTVKDDPPRDPRPDRTRPRTDRVDKKVDVKKNIAEAAVALKAQDFVEAAKLASEVLRVEPTNPTATLQRKTACGFKKSKYCS